MTSVQKSVEDKLQALSALDPGNDPKGVQEALRTALGDRHYRIVAKAAEHNDRLRERLGAVLAARRNRTLNDCFERFWS